MFMNQDPHFFVDNNCMKQACHATFDPIEACDCQDTI